MGKTQSSREIILADVRKGLAGNPASALQPLPGSCRFAPRNPTSLDGEMEMMLLEVKRLSGQGRRVSGRDEFAAAMDELARGEQIMTAAFSDHPLYHRYGIGEILKDCGVRTISPGIGGRGLAECDLGITVADAAIPETGSVLLRTTLGQHDMLSALPRVHLALVLPSTFLADIHQAFALAGGDRHFVMVSGSSRTADIEKVLTLGVHGPKSFHVWMCD